jgi:hypothetical protein
MIPPHNVCLKCRDQLVGIREGVGALLACVVPMVAFAGLVVIPKNTNAIHYVCQSVLESMGRTREWLWQLPKNQLSERHLGVNDSSAEQLDCLHVGDNANSFKCCQ